MDEVATYRERQWGITRDFSIDGDRVTVHARSIDGRSASAVVQLADLNPTYSTIRVRSGWLKPAVTLFCVSIVFTAVIYYGDLMDDLPSWVPWLSVALALLGAILALLTLPLVEFVRFAHTSRPELLMLAIGRTGQDSERFDAFVAQIARRSGVDRTPQQPPAGTVAGEVQ